MKHSLKSRVSKQKNNGGVITCRQTTIRERLFSYLLGSPVKLTVIVPGDSVDEVAISEVEEGGCTNE